jgi:hypothetical protein
MANYRKGMQLLQFAKQYGIKPLHPHLWEEQPNNPIVGTSIKIEGYISLVTVERFFHSIREEEMVLGFVPHQVGNGCAPVIGYNDGDGVLPQSTSKKRRLPLSFHIAAAAFILMFVPIPSQCGNCKGTGERKMHYQSFASKCDLCGGSGTAYATIWKRLNN